MPEFITQLHLEDVPWPERKAEQKPRPGSLRAMPVVRRIGGKQTIDTSNDVFRSGMQFALQLSAETIWRDMKLDERTLDRLPVSRLVELICDLSPEVSKGVWDFQRLGNPGYEYKVLAPKSKDETEDKAGKAIIDTFLDVLKARHGAVDVVLNRLFLAAMLRGAISAELVFDLDQKTGYELATPDPASFTFRQVDDPVLKRRWQLGQFQGRDFVPLEYTTIKYIPIDPLPGRPEGRAPITASLFSAIFLLGLLHDIRRVVQQQGWPRLDLEIQLDAVMASLPEDIGENPDDIRKYVEQITAEIVNVFSQLEPDDAYVHSTMVKVNRPVGAVDASSLGSIDKLITVIERLTIRGLKSIPLLHGATEGVSEANANRQWEIHVAGVKSIQHLVENLLETLFGVLLQANGNQGKVEWRFAELRAAEMMRDAQTEKLRIDNEVRKYNAGWTTQDEGALAITGHVAAEEEPRNPIAAMGGAPGIGNPANAQPDPGANRFSPDVIRMLEEVARDPNADSKFRNATALALLLTTATTEPSSREVDAAEEYWRTNAPDEAKSLIDAESIE